MENLSRFFFTQNCCTQNSYWICFIDILIKPNAFIAHSSVILTLTEIIYTYIYLISIMEALNNLGEKKVKVFACFVFFHLCYFSGEHFNSCAFFYSRLRSCEMFWCVNIYWMLFLVPITVRHVFLKKIIFHFYIK